MLSAGVVCLSLIFAVVSVEGCVTPSTENTKSTPCPTVSCPSGTSCAPTTCSSSCVSSTCATGSECRSTSNPCSLSTQTCQTNSYTMYTMAVPGGGSPTAVRVCISDPTVNLVNILSGSGAGTAYGSFSACCDAVSTAGGGAALVYDNFPLASGKQPVMCFTSTYKVCASTANYCIRLPGSCSGTDIQATANAGSPYTQTSFTKCCASLSPTAAFTTVTLGSSSQLSVDKCVAPS